MHPAAAPPWASSMKCASVTVFTVLATLVKAAFNGPCDRCRPAGVLQVVLCPSAIVARLMWRRKLDPGLQDRRPRVQLGRGLVGTLSIGLNFL